MTITKSEMLNILNAAGMEMMKHSKDYTKETSDKLFELIKLVFQGKTDTELIIDELPF